MMMMTAHGQSVGPVPNTTSQFSIPTLGPHLDSGVKVDRPHLEGGVKVGMATQSAAHNGAHPILPASNSSSQQHSNTPADSSSLPASNKRSSPVHMHAATSFDPAPMGKKRKLNHLEDSSITYFFSNTTSWSSKAEKFVLGITSQHIVGIAESHLTTSNIEAVRNKAKAAGWEAAFSTPITPGESGRPPGGTIIMSRAHLNVRNLDQCAGIPKEVSSSTQFVGQMWHTSNIDILTLKSLLITPRATTVKTRRCHPPPPLAHRVP